MLNIGGRNLAILGIKSYKSGASLIKLLVRVGPGAGEVDEGIYFQKCGIRVQERSCLGVLLLVYLRPNLIALPNAHNDDASTRHAEHI